MSDGGQMGIGYKGKKAMLRGHVGRERRINRMEPMHEEKGCCMPVIIHNRERVDELRKLGLPNFGYIIGVENEYFVVAIASKEQWSDRYRKDELRFLSDFKNQEK